MRSKKIMHLIASNFYGGPEKQIVTHLKRLEKSNLAASLTSFIEGQENEILAVAEREQVRHHGIPMRGPLDFRALVKLFRLLVNDETDLVCAHGYKANVLGRIATWILRKPLVLVSRGWTAENARIRFYEKLDKMFLRFADHIVAVSAGQMDKILKLGVAAEKVSVIHNAIDLDAIPAPHDDSRLRRDLGIAPNTILVASAGRLSPEKNQLGMIKVAGMVRHQCPDVAFVILGEGFVRAELEQHIQDLGLEDCFFLPGFRKDLQQVLHEIDIFMLPSFTEGLPNVVLEAFAVKKPVVASRVGGTPEVVQHGISGFMAEPNETAVMADYLVQLCRNEALRKSMGEAGYINAHRNFDFSQQTLSYEDLYCKVLAGRQVS